MICPKKFFKDPEAVLDYLWDWTKWLAGDTITSHEVFITPTGELSSPSNTITTSLTGVTVWLENGTLGEEYDVTVRIHTAGGRTNDHTIPVLIQAK